MKLVAGLFAIVLAVGAPLAGQALATSQAASPIGNIPACNLDPGFLITLPGAHLDPDFLLPTPAPTQADDSSCPTIIPLR